MATNQGNWHVGDIVTLPFDTRKLTGGIAKTYNQICGSRYVCIREENKDIGQRGILIKIFGRTHSEYITIVNGQPFCKDDVEEGFTSDNYNSYPFPMVEDLKEVLGILTKNQALLNTLDAAGMHVTPCAHFWVKETDKHLLFKHRPQFYNPDIKQLSPSKNDTFAYRITIVHFYKGQLCW